MVSAQTDSGFVAGQVFDNAADGANVLEIGAPINNGLAAAIFFWCSVLTLVRIRWTGHGVDRELLVHSSVANWLGM